MGGVQQSGVGKEEGEEGQCRSHHILFQSLFLFYLITYNGV